MELFNRDGALVQLDHNTGRLIPVNLAAFRDLIANSIAGVRVVNLGGGGGEVWQCEFYGYAFAARPRFISTNANPHPDPNLGLEPDDQVLDQIYRHELAWRLPRVEQK